MNQLQVALFFADGRGFLVGVVCASVGFFVSIWGTGARVRLLAQVIGSRQTTLDGLHLSDAGHAIVAETVGEVLRPATTQPD